MEQRFLICIPRGTLLMALVASLVFTSVPVQAQSRPANFGIQWVRSHPLTIMGAIYDTSTWSTNFMTYQGMNLNTVFANNSLATAELAAASNVPWQASAVYPASNSTPYTPAIEATIASMIAGGGCTAWYLPDEPSNTTDLNAEGQDAAWMRANYPNLLTYVNLGGPQTTSFLQQAVTTIQPDLLMFDEYPFLGSSDTGQWFSALMNNRQVALANHIPYGAWLQAFLIPGDNLRTPSESDARYQGFTLLAAGYTMFNYFMYDNGAAGAGSTTTFFDTNGNPTPVYTYTAAANAEYQHLGQSLRYLTSTDVRFLPGKNTASGSAHSTPTGLTNWASGAGADPHLSSVSVNFSDPTNLGSGKDGLIGFFTDGGNNHYFMLTNLYHGGSLSSSAASLSFTLTFDNSVNDLWFLDRTTGLVQELLLANHTLNRTLPGGTGDLFKYDNGNFAGIVPLPGDFNQDGDVNAADIQSMQAALANPSAYEAAQNMSAANFMTLADVNHDGKVTNADLQSLLNLLKNGGGSTQPVPEPNGCVLTCIGVAVLCLGRYRHRKRRSANP